jgi:hypothetical protein
MIILRGRARNVPVPVVEYRLKQRERVQRWRDIHSNPYYKIQYVIKPQIHVAS